MAKWISSYLHPRMAVCENLQPASPGFLRDWQKNASAKKKDQHASLTLAHLANLAIILQAYLQVRLARAQDALGELQRAHAALGAEHARPLPNRGGESITV